MAYMYSYLLNQLLDQFWPICKVNIIHRLLDLPDEFCYDLQYI